MDFLNCRKSYLCCLFAAANRGLGQILPWTERRIGFSSGAFRWLGSRKVCVHVQYLIFSCVGVLHVHVSNPFHTMGTANQIAGKPYCICDSFTRSLRCDLTPAKSLWTVNTLLLRLTYTHKIIYSRNIPQYTIRKRYITHFMIHLTFLDISLK